MSIASFANKTSPKPKELLKKVNYRYVDSLKLALGVPLPKNYSKVKIPLSALEEVLSVINPEMLADYD